MKSKLSGKIFSTSFDEKSLNQKIFFLISSRNLDRLLFIEF